MEEERRGKRQKTLGAFLGRPDFELQVDETRWTQSPETLLTFSTLPSSPRHGPVKVAAFDLDGTLIKTLSNRTFAKDEHDWTWLDPCVPAKLQAAHAQGFLIVILTNQLGIGLQGAAKREQFQRKVTAISQKVASVPLVLLAALGNDRYRKPLTGMWTHLAQTIVGRDGAIDADASFFVGDAAGRAHGWRAGAGADHASTDRKFALNLGIRFVTPDEYFRGEDPVAYTLDGFDPHTFPGGEPAAWAPAVGQEAVLFVGPPTSGKSTFYSRWLAPHDYIAVSQDTLRTKAQCLGAFRDALQSGSSVVVDGTNAAPAARKAYIEQCQARGIPIRCVYFVPDLDLARHLNVHRALTKGTPLLPPAAFDAFRSQHRAPSVSEGFAAVVPVHFCPAFDSDLDRATFFQYLS